MLAFQEGSWMAFPNCFPKMYQDNINGWQANYNWIKYLPRGIPTKNTLPKNDSLTL